AAVPPAGSPEPGTPAVRSTAKHTSVRPHAAQASGSTAEPTPGASQRSHAASTDDLFRDRK
ncbi:MAG: hypothetical protein ACHQ53_19110, partial [Polyangiales bacterium]